MNLFDIVGPVMVGPSSSHTAGVVRIGNVVNKIMNGVPDRVRIKFHGSFAKTYLGHGSDKAIIAGIMGCLPDDERIRLSLKLATEFGMDFSFDTVELANAHPNTLIVEAENDDLGCVTIRGESVGGGNMVIRRLNDIAVEFDGHYDTLIVNHIDTPGVVAFVTSVLSSSEINIAKMSMYRSQKGGEAILLIEADGTIPSDITLALSVLKNITKSTIIPKLA